MPAGFVCGSGRSPVEGPGGGLTAGSHISVREPLGSYGSCHPGHQQAGTLKTAEHVEIAKLKRKVGQLERALGRETYELEIAGELSRDWT